MKKYRTIYADPPWNQTGGGKIKRGADRHYPLLKESEILKVMKDFLDGKVANDAKRQRQFENSLHFTSMMLYIEKELMTFLQNNIKDNTDEQPTLD